MLKLLYKTLLISLLSCSMMVMDFNSKGLTFNNVQAETVTTQGVKDSDMMATLTMAGVGLLASRLYQCSMTTDMMVAAAGGAAFIAGEILSTIKLKKVMKDMETEITRDKNGNINREQIAALERLKKSYEEAKKTAGTKKMLQQAAAAAFLAAAAVAYTLYTAETTAMSTCTTALAAGGTACQSAFAASCSGAGMTCVYAFQTGAITSNATGPVPAANAATAAIPKPSVGAKAAGETADKAIQATTSEISAQCPAGSGSVAACNAMATVNMTTRGWCPTPPVLGANSISKINPQLYAHAFTPVKAESNLAYMFRNIFISDAKADLFTPLGIASSAAITYLLATSATLGTQIDMYLFSPMNRAIIYGVLAGLSYMASSATDNVVKKIDANIQKIDGILKSMNMMAAGATATQIANSKASIQTTVKPNSQLNFSETDYGEIDLNKDGSGALPCFTGPESGTACKSFTDANKDLPSFKALNVESQKQINGILANANGFNGTSKISSGTLSGSATLAGSAAALRSNVDAAKKKLSDSLKASNSKISIADREKDFSNSIEKAMRDGLKKSKMTPEQMASAIYGGGGSSSSNTASASGSNADKKDPNAKAIVPTVGVIDIGAGAGAASLDAGLKGMNTPEKELSAEELAKLNADQKAVAGSTIDDYDLKNDISPDNSSSIFDLISNRYQKSGYPRLFKIKEAQPAAPVTK